MTGEPVAGTFDPGIGEPASPLLLDRLGRALGPAFEVRGLIGRGGFADVFAVFDSQLGRTLAVKVLRPEIAWGPWLIERFEREARALANLNHLNIPPIHFVGDNEGLIYYGMPLIEGRSLGDLLAASGPLDPGFLVDTIVPILDALEHAHHHGIIHRDIKPDNIIIEERTGRPLLMDFGVAKQVQAGRPGSSLPGVILGTPGYISPEQALGQEDVDARSDIYAIGATMFELLTGVPTFQGGSPSEVISRQISGEIRAPSDLNEQIPGWLSEAILCALARNPEQRFPSATAMAEALRSARNVNGRSRPPALGMPRRIRQDDPTPPMLPVFAPAPVEPPAASSQAREQRRRERRRRPARSAAVWISRGLLVLIGLGLAGYFLLVPERFELRNQLQVPIEISTNESPGQVVAPGATYEIQMPRDNKVLVRWFLVQPPVSSGEQAADPASGLIRVESITLPEVFSRRVTRTVDPWISGAVLFAARVSNTTDRHLRVVVNNRPGESRCNCAIAPHATRLLGYFPLRDESSLRVEDNFGHAVGFTGLEARMDAASGLLDLTIDDTILSRSSLQ